MTKTNSPCYNNGADCPRRYIGCRAECEAWHEWLAAHAEEIERISEKKRATQDADYFSAGQHKRVSNLRRQRFSEKIKRGIKDL